MTNVDLRKLALRWQVIEILRIYTKWRQRSRPVEFWKRAVSPN